MKKIFISVFSLALVFSCTSDDKYDRLNQDSKNPSNVSADVLFTSATKSLTDQMSSTNVNLNVFKLFAQYFTQTTYIDESNYDLNGRSITDNHWSEMYLNVLFDLKDSKNKVVANTELTASEKAGRVAQIEVLSVYTWQQLVDTFGNIPYTEALSVAQYPLPAYDNAETVIYPDLINRLNVAISDLDTAEGFDNVADRIYDGNVLAWKKFANSLKLRIGIRLSDANPTLSKSTVESAVLSGVFTSNADNAILHYKSATPNTNPMWVDLVQSGRKDFIAANTIIDIMNTKSDPRRPLYFKENLGLGTFIGGAYGGNSNSFTSNSQLGNLLHEATSPGVLMDYSEVSFYLAEAAEQTFSVGGTADSFYTNGITASIEYWGGTPSDITTYLGRADVDYATAPGTWREKIGTQFWLAMYNRGFEGWTVWRKYDAPTLNIAGSSGLPVPTRYTYPIDEQNLNESNWTSGSNELGGSGDAQTTKLFWDIY